jgi:hypothetical protein
MTQNDTNRTAASPALYGADVNGDTDLRQEENYK